MQQKNLMFRLMLNKSVLIPAALIVGLLLRSLAALTSLSIDELWSLRLVANCRSALDVLNIKHDNSHPLNSLWLWLLGPENWAIFYRAPALLAAAATGLLLYYKAPSQSSKLWAVAFALCYPLVIIGSEARGYSLMLLMCAISFYSRTTLSLVALGLIGTASHATFLLFAPAMIILAPLAGTIAFLANLLLGFTLYSNLEIGGGPTGSIVEAILNTICGAITANQLTAENLPLSSFILIFSLIILSFGLVKLLLKPEFFSLLVVFIIPSLAILFLQPEYLAVRYLSVPIFFSLRLFKPSFFSLYAPVFAVIIAAHLYSSILLIIEGRGTPSKLLELAELDDSPQISTNNSFQLGFFFEQHKIKSGCNSEYFLLSHHPNEKIPQFICDNRYSLIAQERAATITGPEWGLYRRSAVTGPE